MIGHLFLTKMHDCLTFNSLTKTNDKKGSFVPPTPPTKNFNKTLTSFVRSSNWGGEAKIFVVKNRKMADVTKNVTRNENILSKRSAGFRRSLLKNTNAVNTINKIIPVSVFKITQRQDKTPEIIER